MNVAALSREAERAGWELLTLFGSQARGTARADSDLDLAKIDGLFKALGSGNVDIIWLEDASWLLQQEVARDGRTLYERHPGCWAEFCSEARLRAWDSDIWRRRTRRFLVRSIQEDWQLNRDLVERKTALLAQYLRELKPILEIEGLE